MYSRLIIDGNAVYEIDEECLKQRQGRKGYGGKNRGTKSAFHPERQVRPAISPASLQEKQGVMKHSLFL